MNSKTRPGFPIWAFEAIVQGDGISRGGKKFFESFFELLSLLLRLRCLVEHIPFKNIHV